MADALGTPGPPAGPGVVSALDHRLDQAGLIATQTSSLAVRTGVMVAPGSTALITGTSATGTMTVSIAAHHWVTTRGTADGVYLGTKEAAGTVNVAAAPGANSRIDVVYVKQNDQYSPVTPDGTSAEAYGVVTGTAAVSPTKPALPVGAVEYGTVTVAAGATSTNGAGVTIANTVAQVSARGAKVWVRNQAERDALTRFAGLEVYRIDTGDKEMVNTAGTGWVTTFDPTPDAPAWTNFTPAAAARMDNYAAAAQEGGGLTSGVWGYRAEGWRGVARGWSFSSAGASAGNSLTVAVPVALRPLKPSTFWLFTDAGTPAGAYRCEIGTNGLTYTTEAIPASTYLSWDGVSWPLS